MSLNCSFSFYCCVIFIKLIKIKLLPSYSFFILKKGIYVIYKITLRCLKRKREEVNRKTFTTIIIKNYQKQAIKSMIFLPLSSILYSVLYLLNHSREKEKKFFNAQLSVLQHPKIEILIKIAQHMSLMSSQKMDCCYGTFKSHTHTH